MLSLFKLFQCYKASRDYKSMNQSEKESKNSSQNKIKKTELDWGERPQNEELLSPFVSKKLWHMLQWAQSPGNQDIRKADWAQDKIN